MTLIAPTQQAFISDRLAKQLHASPRTIASYRDYASRAVTIDPTLARLKPPTFPPTSCWVHPERPLRSETKGQLMSDGKVDETKGRAKQAVGDLTGDDSLKNEGKVDEASGKTKGAIGKAADKVKDLLRKD